MNPPPIGPLYCETPVSTFSFPAEPINTITNLVIIGYAVLLFFLFQKKKPNTDLYVLASLLLATGVGSLLWHGYRTGLTLVFDVVPGVLFLLVFIFVWARRVWGLYGGVASLIGFFAFVWGLTALMGVGERRGPPITVVWATVVGSAILFYATRAKYGKVAWLSMVVVALAIIAFFFRSIDLSVCQYLPFGTHFLWHIFLSTAAFAGVLFLQRLDAK